mmetsp:Transcript_26677/g.74920  ORF Transcript_26677/g.74920 Transcript_26677/m.74920 type:complete len:900 (+) Transcript_26677:154-2853(+)|eukprot:CAMPEP_0117661050 /NCGR_PEP_ID=MMETSP0804-20121206/7334_1 /TAXON_ID=1074897 /ORGANISM="Tetraselmis astigmatica, Strain CCMP880" /LENGTH=899 /DNA_ID=CAMNT_0005467899 /DNA_START=94 /DNA_END=2793 /DNA_ORIENTATION=-
MNGNVSRPRDPPRHLSKEGSAVRQEVVTMEAGGSSNGAVQNARSGVAREPPPSSSVEQHPVPAEQQEGPSEPPPTAADCGANCLKDGRESSSDDGVVVTAPADQALGKLEAAWYGSPKGRKINKRSLSEGGSLGEGASEKGATAPPLAALEQGSRSTLDSRGRPQLFKVVVHRAKHLRPRDSNSVIDAMVSVRLAGKRVYSRVAFATTNPIWEQELFIPLPEKMQEGGGTLRITIRDYNKVVMQPRLVGLMEFSFLEMYNQMEGKEGLLQQWYPINRIVNGSQVETGQLLLSMSVINMLQIPTRLVAVGSGAGNPIAVDSEMEELDDWSLRVTMHKVQTISDPHMAVRQANLNDYKYSMTLRFGNHTYTTTYTSPEENHPAANNNPHDPPERYVAWEESFDIPLKQIASRPKMDGKIQNRLMQFGNSMGMDGVFYDSREDVRATDELRFILGRVAADQTPSGRPTKTLREQAEIRGTCQYPLTGIDVLKTDTAMREAMDSVLQSLNEEEEQEEGDSGTLPPPELLCTGHPVFEGLSKLFRGLGAAGPKQEEGASACSPSDLKEDRRQTVHTLLDLRGGAIGGELVVSFKLVKTSDMDDEVASVCSLDAPVDFTAWLAGEAPVEEEEYGMDSHGSTMQMLPPLQDAMFTDEVLDISLDQLFFQLVNMDSAFNKAKKREENIRELQVKEWVLGIDGAVAKQKLSYIIQLPVTKLGPTEAYSEVETIVQTLSPSGFVVQSVISTPKILFGDVFCTVLQMAAVPCGPNKSRLQTSLAVVFRKASMFQGVIRSGAVDGSRTICGKESELLKSVVQNGCRDLGSGREARPSLARSITRSLTIGAVIEDVQKVDTATWYLSALAVLGAALAGLYIYREQAAAAAADFLVQVALAISPTVLDARRSP